ncbi:MAG: hypothetical protein HONBIEJF_00036 [Fimbriimonadaceae bacterium]|nr:hypothetical protein [Fimbriimonadaceae bacterium]
MARKPNPTEEPQTQPSSTSKKDRSATPQGTPKYPYALTPAALSKFLDNIPNKPKPPKVDNQHLKSWDLRNNNDITLVRVLKEVGVLSADSAPTELYEHLMAGSQGKLELAAEIRTRYKELFNAEHEPYASDATATKLFNIHGGTQATKTLQLMRQTFMALCKAADFSGTPARPASRSISQPSSGRAQQEVAIADGPLPPSGPSVVINIQLTLPPGLDEKGYDAFFGSMKKNLWPEK